ncbi:MAG TPA: hypothetical protein VHT03_03360 [Rhizomicrobium sp.]|jgi:hypothetical protein|nr:hypothetical protein [Rhizomicrobium sp.]
MRFRSKSAATRAAVLFLLPALLIGGCQKQQNNTQATHQKAAGGRHQALRGVCAEDIQKYCANADRMRRCLKDNMDKLSDACKAAVAQRGGRRARGNGGNDQ